MKANTPSLLLLLALLIMTSESHAQDGISMLKGPYTIAYVSTKTGHVEIYSFDKAGQSNINRTHVQGGYLAFSPGGNQFAYYAKYDDKKTWSIHTMNTDGTDRKRLTHAKNNWDYAPTWSPDGQHIAFARQYKDADESVQSEIWMMNSDGSGQTQIETLSGGDPAFTPDGRLLFSAKFKGKKSEISIADIDGSNTMLLTDNEADEWHPDISPDGKQIAFMSDRDGNHEIYVMNIDGSNQKRLTFNHVDDWYPSWSPDGSKIIFSSAKVDGKEKHVFIMNKDGSSVTKIIANGRSAVFQH